ncbi:MAG: DUF1636 family protein [Janthinobacterium lividum]
MTDAVRLHICTTCQGGETLAPGDAPMGRHLHDAVAAVAAHDIDLRETTCLANCERGCSAVLSMPGRWTYLLGNLTPALAADLADYARTYAASRNGTVMPSRRAPSLRDVVVGRVPPADDLAAANRAA